jgi:hypothetical protein
MNNFISGLLITGSEDKAKNAEAVRRTDKKYSEQAPSSKSVFCTVPG